MYSLPLDRPHPMAPPPAYAELRACSPVAGVATPDGHAWLITSYDLAATLLADPRFGVAPAAAVPQGNESLVQDGEGHARLRRLLGRAFSARSVAALAGPVERIATDLVSAMAAAGPPADLVDALAAPLSTRVIAELLGVDLADQGRFASVADAALAADPFSLDADARAEAGKVWAELATVVADLVAAKRASLGTDLLSALITVHDTDDGRLSDSELIAMATTLIAAGSLTARNAISVATIQLLGNGRLADLAGPTPSDTVEELLRCQSGLAGETFPRWAHEDVELAGASIRAGDMVLIRIEAANRDPLRFAEPDRFLPGRPAPHLAFGRGPHHCIGAALARLELTAALRALARGLPTLHLAVAVEDIPWFRGAVDAGPVTLPVSW